MQRSPIRVRLTLWYVLLLGLIMAAFSFALYFSLSSSLSQQLDDDLVLAATQVGSEVGQEGGPFSLQNVGSDGALGSLQGRGLTIILLDVGGKKVAANGPYANTPLPAELTSQAAVGKTAFATLEVPSDLRLYAAPYIINGQTAGAIIVGLSQSAAHATLRQLLIILAVAIPITLVVAALFGLFLAARALTPIDRITRAAANISSASLGERLALDLPDDEVGRLARTFDQMLARLDDAFRRQQQFTADASHELRTPLTIVKGEIEVALLHPRSAIQYQQTLLELGEEVDRLTRLVEDLLLLARADHQPLVASEMLDLADLLPAIVAQVQPLAIAKQQQITCAIATPLLVNGDSDKLIRLFLNLLDNAIKYTLVGGCIQVCGIVSGGEVAVDIIDSGVGIAAEHQPHLFDRFYRADIARSRTSGGSGLGLAIASHMARAHQGGITVKSEVGQGSCFTVHLPQWIEPHAIFS